MSRPLHERVSARLARSGIPRKEIARRAGWSARRLGRLMRDDTDLLAEDMEVLARVLGVTVCSLYRDPMVA